MISQIFVRLKAKIKNEKASAVFTMISVVAILSILITTLSVVLINEVTAIARYDKSIKAHYLATTALNQALWELNTGGGSGDGVVGNGCENPEEVELPNMTGECWTTFAFDDTTDKRTGSLEGYGRVGGVEKRISVTVKRATKVFTEKFDPPYTFADFDETTADWSNGELKLPRAEVISWPKSDELCGWWIDTLSVYNNELYATCSSSIMHDIYKYDSGSGTWQKVYTPSNNHRLHSMVAYQDSLYVGCAWCDEIYVYDGQQWTTTNNPGEGTTSSMVVYNDKLYVNSSNGSSTQIWAYDGEEWIESWSSCPEVDILSMTTYDNKLYIGGGDLADSVNGKIYVCDGTDNDYGYGENGWTDSYDPPGVSSIHALATNNGRLYAGTSNAGNIYVSSDGENWNLSFSPSSPEVKATYSLAAYGGKLYAGAGGDRDSSDKTAMIYVYDDSNWNSSLNGNDLADGPDKNRGILSLAVYNGKLYAGAARNGKPWIVEGSGSYQLSGVAQSKQVSQPTFTTIREITFTANHTENGGSIVYYVTANGTAVETSSWQSIEPGQTIDLNQSNQGNDLRWRVELTASGSGDTPVVEDVTIAYTTARWQLEYSTWRPN